MDVYDQLHRILKSTDHSDLLYHFAYFVYNHLGDIENLTIQQIAENCHVVPSSITRLLNKMGYDGLKEYKAEFINNRNYLANYSTDLRLVGNIDRLQLDDFLTNDLVPGLQAITQEQIDKMVSWIKEGDVFVSCHQMVKSFLLSFQSGMITRGYYCTILNEYPSLEALSSSQVAIIISYAGMSVSHPEVVKHLEKCKAKKYLITFNPLLENEHRFDDVIVLPAFHQSSIYDEVMMSCFIEMVIAELYK